MKSRLGLLIILCTCNCGCSCIPQHTTKTKETEYFYRKLKDPNFRWTGPNSKEYRIPKLHAARALAYLGDAGVEFLLYAVEDPEIDRDSVYDALSEVGLPLNSLKTTFCTKTMQEDFAIGGERIALIPKTNGLGIVFKLVYLRCNK